MTHASNAPAAFAVLADAQSEIGMRPAFLTLSGWVHSADSQPAVPTLSLVHAWRQVRQWRALFAAETVGLAGDVLHAHCFSAGMAGVRAGLAVVYDFSAPVGAFGNAGPWLTRSLRIAEGFVLAHAAAVVVHSHSMWDAAIAQGVLPDDLFLIPEPVAPIPLASNGDTGVLAQIRRDLGGDALTFYASSDSEPELLLRAFAMVVEEIDRAHLLFNHPDATIEQRAADLGISGRVHRIANDERSDALSIADVVIAGATAHGPNPLAIAALLHGRTLLAADVAVNREVSAHGNGCLWYAIGKERDLAFRAAFLARNPDFRAALAAGGRAHLLATRGPIAVARQYDEVYRHAVSRPGSRRPDSFLRVPVFALCG